MSITTDDYRRARHITDPAADLLLAAIRPDARGGPGLHPRVLLTGMLLSINTRGTATVADIHDVLTRNLPRNLQWHLGVLTGSHQRPRTLSINQLYKLTQRISAKLDHTQARAPHASDAARAARRDTLAGLTTALLATTLLPRPEGAADYALDGTGIWAAERAPARIPDTTDDAEQANVNLLAHAVTATVGPGKGSKGPSDAAYGGKTGKDGRTEMFYGYDAEAIIRIPNMRGSGDVRQEPSLVEEIVVLPASTHITEPCLTLIDRIIASGQPINHLLVDRHYSYKLFDEWLARLLARGITQVADAHANDQGFRDWDGMRVAAANFHCPLTPDHLATIPTLSPNATAEETRATYALIEERRAYAMQYVERINADGRMRVRCPARNGTIGCPLAAGSVPAATAAGLPTVNPPTGFDPPKVCCQDTVTLRLRTDAQKTAMKLAQPEYWGSPEWRRNYSRRTYIEGWFGVLKSTSATSCHRGIHQFRGLALVTLVIACAAAVTNMRALRSWHHETGLGDTTHPLLQPDQEFHGFIELDADSAHAIDREHGEGVAAAAA